MPNKISQFWSKLKRRKVVRVITVFAAAAFVIVALIILNIIPGNNLFNKKEILDKSIVVLPFTNDSSNEENMYLYNGIHNSIIKNIAKIDYLRVISSTTAAQYGNTLKPIHKIADELNVDFVLQSNVTAYGDSIHLTIKLIDALNEKHLWANTYDWRREELLVLYNEISRRVAEEMKALTIPKE